MDDLASFLIAQVNDQRILVGMAGPPGAGKSTCAEHLNEVLNASGKCRSAIFPMDGFHYDDSILIARGLRSRKGAPETFDVAGFRHMLERLKHNQEPEIAVPVFDRELEISRAAGRMIPLQVGVLIIEGNYILLDREPWSSLEPLFDVTVNIRVPEEVLRQRLYARWEGFGIPADEIPAKVEANDLPNGVLVLAESFKSDFVLRT
ncbi:nucleoside triphosphate hydrolase [Labrys miyagiensis]|uniref:Nucleoside triphosphate hydrolase n=1 Tax=Labrys miyagiensis TaxID=346912 RepID=A0ABQ6CUI4_9HYPH|nr:nucleoside triphosphate hydrolase [Labrys miyagiensis]GLS22379.1 nucleoside triphosphate hydrolase [Labrys miyagiensis]